MQILDINCPLNPTYCIGDTQRNDQMSYAMEKIPGRISKGPMRGDERIAVVCLGPSLLEDWEKIRDYRYIMTCSGSHKFLIDRGIIPTHHVEVDPREHKIELLGTPHPDVEYLIASVCHPKLMDLLADFNTKLWHIYTGDPMGEMPTIFPRGDWVFVGGSNAGQRALVLSRFLGFTNIDVFGMDYSFPAGHEGEHAVPHPNPSDPNDRMVTVYQGTEYHTTPRMLFYAKEFFNEIGLLHDVKVTLYGRGLLQHMSYGGWSRENGQVLRDKSVIAFSAPKLISDEYRQLNQTLHQDNPDYGVSGHKRTDMVLYLTQELKTQNVLDYGCGKGTLAKSLPFPIREYDPAIPGKDADPKPADIVICSDVLEHIEPDYIDSVIGDIARCTERAAYLVIHTGPAMKTLADGRNAHLIQENRAWWYRKLEQHFHIEDMEEHGPELHTLVKPKLTNARTLQDIDKLNNNVSFVESEGIRFVELNNVVGWRAQTIKTKEPITYEWIMGFSPMDVFVDVGANIGVYTLLAAKKRNAQTIAFEPESQNYWALTQNIFLNRVETRVKAYCLSLSDRIGAGDLNLAEFRLGSSCHQFNRLLNFKEEPSDFVFQQGSFAITLDSMLVSGGIPQPTHIKIDVDGQEPLVVKGAMKTLANTKSVLIEVNEALDSHQDMIKTLESMGFKYDNAQVELARRKEGPFKGCAEYLFRRH
jgi:FkbM family methyltransferase